MKAFNLLGITLGTLIRFLSIALLIIGMVLYIHFQARNFIQGPKITLNHIDTLIQHERRLVLTGNAQNIVKLTFNGKEIHTNAQGEFSHDLVLENGYTIMEIDAQDRFGRTTSLVREYMYVPLQG